MRIRQLLFGFLFCLPCALSAQPALPSVEIIRDSFGVPHIFAETDAGAAFGLGWAHSEDDFPSIFQNLLLSRARLGELLGVEGAKMDFFAHFTGARQRVRERFDQDVSQDYQRVMQGYVDGINAYAGKYPKEVPLKGVIPFTIEDLETAFGITFAAMSGVPMALEATMANKPYRSPISWGSNGFAVNSKASDNGETFLVNDPHWLTDGSLTFYEVHLSTGEGWEITGGCYPGTPMPVNAVNRHLGWNLPFNFPDLVDIYRMEMHPTDKLLYRWDGKWERFEVEEVKLRVKTPVGKLAVKKEILHCKYGPALRTEHGVFAFRLYSMDRLGAGEQLYRMGKARNLAEFQQAVGMQRMPLFNIVYGDAADNIWYIYNALVPRRDVNFDWNTILRGDTSANLWTTYLPLSALPQVLNPGCGYIYNTNSSPWQCTCAEENPKNTHPTTRDFFDPENDRSIRFRELVGPGQKLSYAGLKAIKYDLLYPAQGGGIRQSWERVCALDPQKYPEIADVLVLIRAAKLDGGLENRHTALFTYAMYSMIEEHKPNLMEFLEHGLVAPEADFVAALSLSKKRFLKYHRRIDPTLGEVQRLVRGELSLPADGLPQNLNGTEAQVQKDGTLRVNRNSSFLQMVRFTAEGPVVESIVPYGSSNRAGSRHYSDQSALHAKKGLKPFEWDREKLREKAERVYRPE